MLAETTYPKTLEQKTNMTRQEAIEKLCAPGQPFELKFTQIRGKHYKVFSHAPETLRDLYEETRSDLEYLVFEGERMTFDQVYRQSSALGSSLVSDFGVAQGDRVAIAMRNYPEWVVIFLAVTSIGAIAVSMNAHWSAQELSYGLEDCGAKLVFVDQERLHRLSSNSSVLLHVGIIRVRAEENINISSTEYKKIVSAHINEELPFVQIGADDDATLIYTSGSTGRPKGAVSSHRSIINALLSWELDVALRSFLGQYEQPKLSYQESFLLSVPLFHVSGSHVGMLASLRAQRRLILMYKWDADIAMDLIERERVTVFTAAPAITGDFIQAALNQNRDLSGLLVVGGGGASRAPEQVRKISLLAENVVPSTGWGMTETNAIGTGILGKTYLDRPSSGGQCAAILELRVVDAQGHKLGPDSRGELQVRGTSMFRCYWNRPEENVTAFDGDWFRTGDIALIDRDGFVFIVDRVKDIIIRGGENIACIAVEDALVEHADVIEACVYAVPDDRLGEDVGATIFVSKEIDIRKLETFLQIRLASFEIPAYVRQQVTPLPRGASGKILKRALKAEAISKLLEAP